MRLSGLITYDREYRSSLQALREQHAAPQPLPLIVNGLSGGATCAYLAEAVREARGITGRPVLILTGEERERDRILSALQQAELHACAYLPRELVLHSMSASHDAERERLSVLAAVQSGSCDAVVTTPSAALLYTMPVRQLSSLSLTVSATDTLTPQQLTERLLAMGYARTELVDGVGQFAKRGGIVDFYPKVDGVPTRVEFFGNEIDRIVSFEPVSQRATGPLTSVQLLPATETPLDEAARGRMLAAVEALLARAEEESTRVTLLAEREALRGGRTADFRDKYLGLLYEQPTTLLDYMRGDIQSGGRGAVFICGTAGMREELKRQQELYAQQRSNLLQRGLVTPEAARYMGDGELLDSYLATCVTVHLNPFSGGVGTLREGGLFGFRCRRTVCYGDNPRMLREDLSGLARGQYRVILLVESRAAAEALIASLAEDGTVARPLYDNPSWTLDGVKGPALFVAIGEGEGFDLINARIALLSLARDEGRAIMAHRRRQRILRRSGGAGQKLMSYAELAVGDYVVHENYGIGLFEGIESVTVDGVTRDYITIRYAGTDKLFVPCDRLEMIGKYIGEREQDGTVKLSRMGGADWTRTKTRAKTAVRDIAKQLIALYAERQRRPGYAFPADCEMEEEFADAFEFQETDAQLTAMDEIRQDMMKPVPMNRLLCGDVGFGKTEVALRAAFKAIVAGKQVALLVPTTILALQHYQTALSRMRGYAVRIDMLSRFRTAKEQERILRAVKRGEIDLLIGTHKLLSGRVEFRDLGLLIVDEEQRFGVVQKERLKAVAKNVDVLTLTATPIPRTLNMAMNGISDMSILDEAPQDRRPVQTYVLEHDDLLLAEAMRRELARGGQVLYLYNRVETISYVADRISRELPEARVAYAHGQTDRDELEDIWQMLVRGEIDILVATTIIETGVDLPGANTLIIEDADRMGLSQLHQLRGRVGRSERQAYAYFTYRRGKALSEVATKRLQAIREFAEFGAGFKIALRDLEIRGAGNLLGAEQHGYMDSVGYELYIRLLNEAVLEEQGTEQTPAPECTVDVRADANLPEYYIDSSSQRMEMYKKISLIRTKEDMEDVTDELIDRFGEPPRATLRLLHVALTRALGEQHGIRRVEVAEGQLRFHVERPELAVWSELFAKYRGLSLRTAPTLSVVYRLPAGRDATDAAMDILIDYSAIAATPVHTVNDTEKESHS